MNLYTVHCSFTDQIVWNDFNEQVLHQNLVVFKIELPEFASLISRLSQFLDAAEMARAERYHFEKDKNRFIVVRAALRILLSKLTGTKPSQVQFALSPKKKPFLTDFPDVHFNVSHSGEVALIAISKKEVGVDVEYLNQQFSYEQVLDHSFSFAEKAFITQSAEPLFSFYQLWTRKEALVKATSKGLPEDLRKIPSLDGDHFVDSEISGDSNWLIRSFKIGENGVGTVVCSTENPDLELDFVRFRPDNVNFLL